MTTEWHHPVYCDRVGLNVVYQDPLITISECKVCNSRHTQQRISIPFLNWLIAKYGMWKTGRVFHEKIDWERA